MRIAVFTDLYLEIAGGIPSSISAQKKELEKLGRDLEAIEGEIRKVWGEQKSTCMQYSNNCYFDM